jgi:hypothetical protein
MTNSPPVETFDHDYAIAIEVIGTIPDDDYRSAAVEAVIRRRVVREQGHEDPAGGLAMKLRREAAETIESRRRRIEEIVQANMAAARLRKGAV